MNPILRWPRNLAVRTRARESRMSSLERRGKWIFLVLAGLIFIDQMFSGVLGLFPREGAIRWRTVLGAFGMAVAVPMLWQGDLWLSRLVAAALAFAGAT